ncbi:TonB-dependent receptor plug domain-containing protein [Endozoicomonas sp.]|uniref:TonB-dependent receptor plug domain-containing protein n=1 Tax=Endozoicomonas sp. TaxID=1892382 RepID=UPI003AF482EC
MKQSNNSLLLAGIFSSLFIPLNIQADSDLDMTDDELLDLSLEELISLDVPDVTSVSKRKQRLMDSPAAVFVITDEDIQRSGVTSIPEALRMVPGMQVARLNGNTWSISTRGFNYIFANKLLVLIDGRTVYSPLFSGVNWDVQDTMLEDIARIEVIRGPGAALWGANAVNGVINIITKHAADTQGGLLSTGFGSEEKAFAAYRYGGEISDDGYYRAFFKTFTRDGLANSDGTDANDDWKINRAGLRADWQTETGAEASVQGEVYDGTTRPPLKIFNYYGTEDDDTIVNLNRAQQGGHLIGNYKQYYSDGSNFSLRGYYDRYENYDYRVTEKRDIGDLEFQHHILPWDNHDIIWGLGYRLTKYNLSDMNNITMPQTSRTDELYSAFIQDHITLSPTWSLALSSRFEHNDFTGYEIQPNAKVTWKAAENRTFWGSLSRAVKTPSISETEVTTRGINILTEDMFDPLLDFVSNPPYLMSISGNNNLNSESLTAFELGYREQFNNRLRLDVTAFLNKYDDILAYVDRGECYDDTTVENIIGLDGQPTNVCVISGTTQAPPFDAILEFPTTFTNGLSATAYGVEFALDWQVNDWWKLHTNFSALQIDAKAYQNDIYHKENEVLIEELSASSTANIRSSMNLPNQWYLDFWVRYMDNLKNAKVGAYTALDFRVAKKIGKDLEVSLTGKNLFDKQRLEFSEIFSGLGATEVQESWYLQLRWQH